jgi:hypothetical protein
MKQYKFTDSKPTISNNQHPLKQDLLKKLQSTTELGVYNDAELQILLGESKRSLAYLRQRGQIAYIQKKPRGKVQYLASDVLTYLNQYRHAAVHEFRKF